jgi:hypothetical protein
VDPLSRLPRALPEHISPIRDSEKTIITDSTLAEAQERQLEIEPAKRATFVAWGIEDCVEGERSAWITTRSRTLAKARGEPERTGRPQGEEAAASEKEVNQNPSGSEADDPPLLVEVTDEDDDEELEGIEQTEEYWGAHNPPPSIHIAMDHNFQLKFVAAYLSDPAFGPIWSDPRSDEGAWTPGYRYFKNQDGLLLQGRRLPTKVVRT